MILKNWQDWTWKFLISIWLYLLFKFNKIFFMRQKFNCQLSSYMQNKVIKMSTNVATYFLNNWIKWLKKKTKQKPPQNNIFFKYTLHALKTQTIPMTLYRSWFPLISSFVVIKNYLRYNFLIYFRSMYLENVYHLKSY